jgi:hypothetical protein
MAKKKKIIRRVEIRDVTGAEPKPKAEAAGPEKPRIPERIREKDSGFGVIKTVVGIIIALVVGSTVLFKQVGRSESERGEKQLEEPCQQTSECLKGLLCYAYKNSKKQCLAACVKDKCDDGYTCVPRSDQPKQQGRRILDICVRNAKR